MEDYATNKSFAEDLTEGKFSFPIVHAIKYVFFQIFLKVGVRFETFFIIYIDFLIRIEYLNTMKFRKQ